LGVIFLVLNVASLIFSLSFNLYNDILSKSCL